MHRLLLIGLLLSLPACAKQEAPASKQPAPPPAEEERADTPAPTAPGAAAADEEEAAAAEKGPSSLEQKKAKPKKAELIPALNTLEEAEAELERAQALLEKSYLQQGQAVALSGGDSRCDTACSAFGSLKRAADAICRLAGENDTRCSKARKVVDEHEKRVEPCGCPAVE